MIGSFLTLLADTVFSFISMIFAVLPSVNDLGITELESTANDSSVTTVVSMINYFIPVSNIALIVGTWAIAMLVYFAVKIAMKWAKQIS